MWSEKFMDMALRPMISAVLDAMTASFHAIAVDASCTHRYGPGTHRHFRNALELGATNEEITAALQCVSGLGAHTMSLGLPNLRDELEAAAKRRDAAPQDVGKA